jgi:hypothetical protein
MSDVDVSSEVKADAATVWRLVSDVTRMGEWSPETTSCRWLGSADGPAPGARFSGTNRKGLRVWRTTCTVTDATPGRTFAFDVDFWGVPISRWEYQFVEREGVTSVTESWTDKRPGWMKLGSVPVMGIADRAGHNRRTMEATLAALKAAAEA